jgi:hypothetical protein
MTKSANAMRWRFQPGHYEVWYATLSHLASRTGFWIRYTLLAPRPGHGEPYAALWFARFDPEAPERTFGIHRRFPIADLLTIERPFSLHLGGAELRDGKLAGKLAGRQEESGTHHEAQWSLSFEPGQAAPHLHLPTLAYHSKLPETHVLSPHLRVGVHGHIIVDGQRYDFDGDPLGQSHVWGRKHAYSWAWSHTTAFAEAPEATLETLSVLIRKGPLVLPKVTLLSLVLGDGEKVEFREPAALLGCRSEYGTGRYLLRAAGLHTRIEAEITGRPEDVLLTEYVDPDGDPAYCHNTECASGRVTLWRRSPFSSRFRLDRTLHADRTAHYEWGARAGDPQVRKRHLLIS